MCIWQAHRGDEYAGSKPTRYINLRAGNLEGLSWVIQSNVHHSLNLRISKARSHQQTPGLDFWRDIWDLSLVRVPVLRICPCCFVETWICNVKPHFPALQVQAFPSLKHNCSVLWCASCGNGHCTPTLLLAVTSPVIPRELKLHGGS